MTENKKRAVIYCRVSTKEQAEEGSSLTTQERVCREYAFRHSYEIVSVFIEHGESAKTRERTQLKKLLAFCTDIENKINVVIAYKIDRISRNVDDYSFIRHLLRKKKVEIRSTSENLEDTPVGKFMENMLANVSQFDNDIRAERSINGMKDAVREGRYICIPPYGYCQTRLSGKSNIYPNDKSVWVKRAFAEIAKNNASVDAVHRMLISEGMINNSGKPLSRSQFYRLLQNEVYIGWINRFKERNRGTFEPLVSEELFKTVQYVLKRKSHKGFIYTFEREDFPLRRFVRNKNNVNLTGYWAKGRTKRYPYYRFIGQRKTEVRKDRIEQAFVQFLDCYRIDKKYLLQLRKSMESAYKVGNAANQERLSKLKAKIQELKERQNILIQKNIKGFIPDTVLRDQMELIEQDTHELYSEQTGINEETILAEADWSAAIEYLNKPSKIWLESNLELRKKLQWFAFPTGVIYDNGKFRTTKVASIFNIKNDILPPMSHSADRTRLRSNKLPLPSYQEYITQIANLSEIIATKDV